MPLLSLAVLQGRREAGAGGDVGGGGGGLKGKADCFMVNGT